MVKELETAPRAARSGSAYLCTLGVARLFAMVGALSARDASLAAYLLPRDGDVRRVGRRKSVVAGFARGMSAGRWWGMVGAMGGLGSG